MGLLELELSPFPIRIEPARTPLLRAPAPQPVYHPPFACRFSQYRPVLPISFVFGVSTCASAVHQLLPQHVSARLSLQKFHSQLASHCLAEMIDQVRRAVRRACADCWCLLRRGDECARCSILFHIFPYQSKKLQNIFFCHQYIFSCELRQIYILVTKSEAVVEVCRHINWLCYVKRYIFSSPKGGATARTMLQ